MINILQRKWKESWAPILSGIHYIDGRYAKLTPPASENLRSPITLIRAPLSHISNWENVEWSHIGGGHIIDKALSLKVTAGEGSWGSDGFVAVESLVTPNTLLWIAFFDYSNPFRSVTIENEIIRAVNNLEAIWEFPLDSPADVTVIPGQFGTFG